MIIGRIYGCSVSVEFPWPTVFEEFRSILAAEIYGKDIAELYRKVRVDEEYSSVKELKQKLFDAKFLETLTDGGNIQSVVGTKSEVNNFMFFSNEATITPSEAKAILPALEKIEFDYKIDYEPESFKNGLIDLLNRSIVLNRNIEIY